MVSIEVMIDTSCFNIRCGYFVARQNTLEQIRHVASQINLVDIAVISAYTLIYTLVSGVGYYGAIGLHERFVT